MAAEAPDIDSLVAELVSRPAWHRQAACRGVGVAAFYPQRGQAWDRRRAMALCEGCPVRSECLSCALGVGEHSVVGFWGGTTAQERRAMRRGVA